MSPQSSTVSQRTTFLDDSTTASNVRRIAELRDEQIAEMNRDEIVECLSRLRPPFLERRVFRRLEFFDGTTLQRILFLCRRCCRNQLCQSPASLMDDHVDRNLRIRRIAR